MFAVLAGQRRDLITAFSQHGNRQTRHSASRPRHNHTTTRRCQPVLLHTVYRQCSGKTSRTQRHRFEQGETLRQWHHPISRQAHVFGKTAIVRHTHPVAGSDHLVTRLKARIA